MQKCNYCLLGIVKNGEKREKSLEKSKKRLKKGKKQIIEMNNFKKKFIVIKAIYKCITHRVIDKYS